MRSNQSFDDRRKISHIGKVKVVVKRLSRRLKPKISVFKFITRMAKKVVQTFFLYFCSIYVSILLLSYGAKLD